MGFGSGVGTKSVSYKKPIVPPARVAPVRTSSRFFYFVLYNFTLIVTINIIILNIYIFTYKLPPKILVEQV